MPLTHPLLKNEEAPEPVNQDEIDLSAPEEKQSDLEVTKNGDIEKCHFHANMEATQSCEGCGIPLCSSCQVNLDEHIFCKSCSQRHETKQLLGIY